MISAFYMIIQECHSNQKGGNILYLRRIISILTAILSISVCGFITYISRDVTQSTLLFNLLFLGIMLLMILAACIAGSRHLIQDCSKIRNATQSILDGEGSLFFNADETAEVFHQEFLDNCFHQYSHMLRSNPNTSCDIQSFLNEEVIENHAHRGLLELIPDILTSLGILGTFVGLVMGLREFDPSGYAQMADSITPLINGIKVAFITSIYGISLSLAFSFHLRSELGNLSNVMDEFLDAFYLHVRPPYEVDSLSKLLDNQKSQEEMQKELNSLFVEQMVQSFEQVVTPAFNRMTDGLNEIVDAFTAQQEKAVTRICETLIWKMHKEVKDEFDQITATISALEKSQHDYTVSMEQLQRTYMNFMEDSQHHYSEFLEQSLEHLQKNLLSMEQSLAQMNEYSTTSCSQLNAAYQDALQTAQEQKAAYQDYIRFMNQSIDNFSNIWEQNSQSMMAYSDEIARLGPVQFNRDLKEELHIISGRLQTIEKHQRVAMMSEDYTLEEDIADMLRNTLRKLDDLEDLVSAPSLFRSRRGKKKDAK